MADEQNDKKVISKNNSGFPPYLDFDKLRSEGIDYLGKLSGKIWTDHNVHDPGITILEMLSYGILDLGYRTNLPVKDIFSKDPEVISIEDNFLTPSQILTCNPLTITDFRKLLIDIDGIKNAWLEPATDVDVEKLCSPTEQTPQPEDNYDLLWAVNTPGQSSKDCCINYLNGLYHVYLELEDNTEAEIKDGIKKKAFLKKVKGALMKHRNLCEDFIDIKILCKWETGVCAEIELEADTDPEKVYLEMIEKLRAFFSPSPQFYTLPQLLDKKKTIDEIFSGRPYNITESHGFVDSEEFEKLTLKKTIHVSDVYNILFSIAGIRNVNRLRLRNCTEKSNNEDKWEIKIPKDHVPDFSISCSGFQFNRQGIPLAFDFKKYDELLQISFDHTGKVLYKTPTDKLDSEIPKGIFHKDLGDYYSIQHEFPSVYGIAEGGLSASAPPRRVAQALQLKGYLLFFDQLFANYLSQLKNLRSLFSLSPPAVGEIRQTYFINQPGSVPDLEKLVQYKVKDDNTTRDNSLLAIPVDKEWFYEKIHSKDVTCLDIENIKPFSFHSGIERDLAIRQLQEYLPEEKINCNYITKNDGCVFYYIIIPSADFVLISSRYYKDIREAGRAVDSLIFAAITSENFHSFSLPSGKGFSFDIESGVTTYSGYLQLLAEDKTLNFQRRQSFLQHLLARFAERFTDFAILSFGHYSSTELENKDISAKEFFLSNYAQLSSNRGKALDYTANGWNNENNSGLEKRFKALTGINNFKRQSLCNFEVYEYAQKFVFTLSLAGKMSFLSEEKFESESDGAQAANKLFEALGNRFNYHVRELSYKKGHTIQISYGGKKDAIFGIEYSTEKEATEAADRLQKMFSKNEVSGEEVIASYKYSSKLNDHTGLLVRTYAETYNNEKEARVISLKNINKINDNSIWKKPENGDKVIGKLIHHAKSTEHPHFIDLDKFEIDIDRTTIGKPGIVTYEILDKDHHRFRFRSLNEFQNEKLAREEIHRLLCQMLRIENYTVQPENDKENWGIIIVEGENQLAISVYKSEQEAVRMREVIHQIVTEYSYRLSIDALPDTWKFKYNLGYEPGNVYTLQSQNVYASKEEATLALKLFHEGIGNAVPENKLKDLILRSGKVRNTAIAAKSEIALTQATEDQLTMVKELLAIHKDISRLHDNSKKEKAYAAYIEPDDESNCRYVYHLVDKDAVMAVYKGEVLPVPGETRKQLIKKNISEYNFPELCLRGDVTIVRTGDGGKNKWYHYQLKTVNTISNPGGGAAEKLVLFESTKGYLSKEEAESAFAEEYHTVLKWALVDKNYGERKPISLHVIRVQSDDPCVKSESMVFVPAETLAYLGIYIGGPMVNLVTIVQSYPVRSFKRSEDCVELYSRFLPCIEGGCEDLTVECNAEKEKPVYFFILYDKKSGKEHWQSMEFYESAQSAMEAFRFFLMLLKYEGNYYQDCDCTGKTSIYIREVLAESTDRFQTPAAAWGENGIQDFINVSQTQESFYPLVDDDCCNKFFVACKNIRVIHPCKYDTPQIRDRALDELYEAAFKIGNWNFTAFCNRKGLEFIDFNGQNISFVTLNGTNILRPGAGYLENYIDIIGYINSYSLCIDEENKEVYVKIDESRSIHFGFIQTATLNTIRELKKKLLWISCYFPFSKKDEGKSGSITYCIELRLPGFNTCEKLNVEENEICQVAWTSECCYNSCEEIVAAYKNMIDVISNRQLYKKVFDCFCGSYGISLHSHQTECFDTEKTRNVDTGKTSNVSRIIAMNPQCYPSAELVCSAIERAKRLINSEGLQLIEHILLRPHCDEDCDCRVLPCDKNTDTRNKLDDCRFKWKGFDDKDPCNKDEKSVCFIPGQDPYSFIATVALPAWSERFRKKESREIIENILYREAPAHVALRILWLTPHDLCCFEKHLKKWMVWMAYQKSCDINYTTCDFINFLFRREFECLAEPVVCDTCILESADISCIDTLKKEEANNQMENSECHQNWLQQITELYCWEEYNCSNEYFVNCEEFIDREKLQPSAIALAKVEPRPQAELQHLTQEPEPSPLSNIDKSSKAKFVNGRLAAYRKSADEILSRAKKSNEKELIEKARSFLKANKVSIKEYMQLVTDLLKLAETKKDIKTGIGKKQVQELIGNLSYFFLDKNCFNSGGQEELDKCRDIFAAMRKSGIDLAKLYMGWGPAAVKKFEPALNIKAIEKLFAG